MIRESLLLLTALVASSLAQLRLPLPADDPLRGTLVVLPLVVGALASVARWARSHGGRATPGPVVFGETAVLASTLLLTLGRRHLGLTRPEEADRLLAGALALLLAHRVWRLLRELRPSLGARLPRRPPWPFFALPLIVYVAILPWSSVHHPPDGDEPHYLLLTHSLAYDLDADLKNNYERGDSRRFVDRRLQPQPGDPLGRRGELYSRHNMLLPLLLSPFYRFGGLAGALLVMNVLAALTCWLTLAVAHDYVPDLPGPALVAWAVLALTAPLVMFSYQVWVEVPAALLVLVALRRIALLEAGGGRALAAWLGLTLPLVLLPLLKIRFLLVAAPLAALALWRGARRFRRQVVWGLVALMLLAGGTLVFNQIVFDNPLKYHDIDGLRPYLYPPAQYARGLTGLFFDCAFGLFAFAPIWILLLPAALQAMTSRRRLVIDFLIVFLPYLLLLAPRGEWFGGWSPPFRYGMVWLPLLALWLIPLLGNRHRAGGRMLLSGLAAATLALTLLWLVEPGWTYNLAHGRSHLLDQLGSRFAADVARFFPSSTRPRTASLLWPPLAFALTTLVWGVRRRPFPPRRAAAWGVALALLSPALVCWAARHRATRVIEFEDPWIRHDGGEMYPGPWVVYRPQYRGGWKLPAERELRVPVVPGGGRVSLDIELRILSPRSPPAALEVRNRQDGITERRALREVGRWTSVSFDGLPWSVASELIIALRRPSPSAERLQVILDRASLEWAQTKP